MHTCQLIALSVKHWRASPSGRRTGSFCSDTNSDRMVSNLGLLDRWHSGHRNLESLLLLCQPTPNFFWDPVLGRGTHAPWNQSLQSSHCNMKPLAVFRHRQNFTSSMRSAMAILAKLAARREWMDSTSFCSLDLKAATTVEGSRTSSKLSSRSLRASGSKPPLSFSMSSLTRFLLLLLLP